MPKFVFFLFSVSLLYYGSYNLIAIWFCPTFLYHSFWAKLIRPTMVIDRVENLFKPPSNTALPFTVYVVPPSLDRNPPESRRDKLVITA